MEKFKVYYDAKSGYLCDRYPKDIKASESSPFIEVSEEELEKTYSCPYGKFWGVKNKRLELLEDVETQNSSEYKRIKAEEEIYSLKDYLSSTDYVISKLNEARIVDEQEYEKLKIEYAEILNNRKEARARINELEGELLWTMYYS